MGSIGYEKATAQGLMVELFATITSDISPKTMPFLLDGSEAHNGILVYDITIKYMTKPNCMITSSVEYCFNCVW